MTNQQQMAAQMNEMSAHVAELMRQNNEFRAELQRTEQLRQAAAAGAATATRHEPRGANADDLQKIGKPSTFSSKDDDWPEWDSKFRAYLGLLGNDTLEDPEQIDKFPSERVTSPTNPEELQRCRNLRHMLTMLTTKVVF
jgi:hypothetical protein